MPGNTHDAGPAEVHANAKVSRWRAAALSLAVALLTVTCWDGPLYGDDLYEVQIENATAAVLVVTEMDAFPSGKPMVSRVDPGKVLLSAWRRPREGRSNERALVRAENETGELLFCQRYTFADIKRLKHRITIHPHEIAC
jgi:hypothetical protein